MSQVLKKGIFPKTRSVIHIPCSLSFSMVYPKSSWQEREPIPPRLISTVLLVDLVAWQQEASHVSPSAARFGRLYRLNYNVGL